MPGVALPRIADEFTRLAVSERLVLTDWRVTCFCRTDGDRALSFECRSVECHRGVAWVTVRLLEELNVWGAGDLSAHIIPRTGCAWYPQWQLDRLLHAVGIERVAGADLVRHLRSFLMFGWFWKWSCACAGDPA
jgi:hypothetical protein